MATGVPNQIHVGPWYATAIFWKRSTVFLSIALSVTSLILSAIASLSPERERTLNVLKVAGVIVNSFSIMLSAITSLDWKKQATHDKQFAAQLLKVTHVHEGNNIVITTKTILPELSPSS